MVCRGLKTVRNGADTRTIATVTQADKVAKAEAEAKAIIRNAFSAIKEKLDSQHVAWWHNFYRDAAFLTFPDKNIERFWWFQYYKFTSTARPGNR